MEDRRPEFVEAARMIECSVLGRTVVRVVRDIEAAVITSRTASLLARVRITQINVVTTSFCVTQVVLLQFVPARLAPVKPLAYGMVLAFTALVIALGRITTRSRATARADNSAGTANAIKS